MAAIMRGVSYMSKVYAVINQKGGVSKSTTAQAMIAGFTLRGYKVLGIDLDPQGNTTFSLGGSAEGMTALDVLAGDATAAEAVQHTKYGDIIPAAKKLASVDKYLPDTAKEYRLREALEQLIGSYDYIVIDTPPVLGTLTVNALTACDGVIIPAQPDIYSLQGIADLADTIRPVKKYCNPSLIVEGIVFTRYSSRSAFRREIVDLAEELAKNIGTKIFKSSVREAVAIGKAQAARMSIYDYEPNSKVAADYTAFVNELIGEEQSNGKNTH